MRCAFPNETNSMPEPGTSANAILRLESDVIDGETFTIGDVTYELDASNVEDITDGNTRVDISDATTHASVVMTVAANPSANETVAIAGTVYTYKSTLTNSAGYVLIGDDVEETIDNIIAALNRDTTAGIIGVKYASATTANAYVTGEKTTTSTATFTAIIGGSIGNSYTTSTAAASTTFGSAYFTGGVNCTATDAITAIRTSIAEAQNGYIARTGSVSGNCVITREDIGANSTACSETFAGSNNTITSTFQRGTSTKRGFTTTLAFVPSTADVTAGEIVIDLTYQPSGALCQVRVTSSGAAVAWDGKCYVDTANQRICIDNSGSTDWSASHTINLICWS